MGACNSSVSYTLLAEDTKDTKAMEKQNRRIVKNILVLSVFMGLLAMAYHGLSWLQAVLFMEHSLGTTCQAIVHFIVVFSSLLLPRLFIVKLGQKWTIVICAIGFMLWMVANAFADWYTLGITSGILGICGGPLATAQASYITKNARLYAKLNDQDPQDTIARMFGVAGAIGGTFKIMSGLSSAFILTPASGNSSTVYVPSEEDLEFCGRNDCPTSNASSHHNHHYEKIDNVVLYTLVTVYLIITLCAILLAVFFLDPIPDELQDPVHDTSTVWRESMELLTATVRLLIVPELVLLIPLFLVPGMDFAFFHADWAKSYVTCALGMAYIGWTAIPQALVNIPSFLVGGFLTKAAGRHTMILIGIFGFLVVNIIQLSWMPRPEHLAVFFIVAILYGLYAIVNPARDALIGTEFPDNMDAVFAFVHVWGSLGGSVAFAYSGLLCTSTKLYLLVSVVVLSVLGYSGAEVLFWRKRRRRARTHEYEQVEMDGGKEDNEDVVDGKSDEDVVDSTSDEIVMDNISNEDVVDNIPSGDVVDMISGEDAVESKSHEDVMNDKPDGDVGDDEFQSKKGETEKDSVKENKD